jgi:hypothetical protein
MTSVLNVFLPT